MEVLFVSCNLEFGALNLECWALVLQILKSPELSESKVEQLLAVFEFFVTMIDGNQFSSYK